jgi:ABC-2 type transport system permease protein
MTNTWRIFTIGGLISYRALFNWMSPTYYMPTMLAGPVFQILFFTYLGRFAATESDAFFVIGNGIQVCAMSAVFGMALTVGGERWTQTLGSLLATPANRAALFLGRALPNIANGVFVSAFGLVVASLMLGYRPAPSSVPEIAILVVLCTCTCSAFGLAVGALGLRFRDVFMIANPAYFLMLLFCGVNVPVDRLPGWMATIGSGLPLTHGIAAAREVAAGASLSSVSGLIGKELEVGLAWAVGSYLLLRFFEAEGRRRATLETM